MVGVSGLKRDKFSIFNFLSVPATSCAAAPNPGRPPVSETGRAACECISLCPLFVVVVRQAAGRCCSSLIGHVCDTFTRLPMVPPVVHTNKSTEQRSVSVC